MTWLVNFILNHTGRRWDEMQESTIRIQLAADKAIGQLDMMDTPVHIPENWGNVA